MPKSKEEIRAYKQQWYQVNKAQVKQRARDWAAAHPERSREIKSNWQQRNRKHVNFLARQHRARNKGKVRAWLRDYAKREAARFRLYASKRRAMLRAAAGTISKQDWDLLLHLARYHCLCCGAITDLSLDHIEPLSWGGEHTIFNAQVLCIPCNSSKHNRHNTDYRDYIMLVLDLSI